MRSFRLDVELAVLVLHEAFGTGDDHGADRIGALDVAVVVDLDALRRLRQASVVGQRVEQAALRRGIGELAAERFARIGQRVGDQLLLLAALRRRDLDLVAGLDRQRVGKQLALLDLVREQDGFGGGLSS